MKKIYGVIFLVTVMIFLGAGKIHACALQGYIWCDVNQNGVIDPGIDIRLEGVTVKVTSVDGTFSRTVVSLADGGFYAALDSAIPDYIVEIIDGPRDFKIMYPLPIPFKFSVGGENSFYPWQDFLLDSPTCHAQTGACWMTAGGVKFDPDLGYNAAQKGPRFNFGGNTFPGCSPTAGDGGQWSFVDREQNIHFQAWQIDQVKCGNVEGIPPGSTSPVTPFNYIDFSGWGTVKPLPGNAGAAKKAAGEAVDEPQKVYFFAHFEDRNEPGNGSALDPFDPTEGAKIDRLYLRVCSSPCVDTDTAPANPIYLIDVDGNPKTVDPVLITGGNIQIHISSCP